MRRSFLILGFFVLVLFLNLPKIEAADSDIIINEVMVDPACANDSCEWVELYNNGSHAIDLKDWSLGAKTISSDVIIQPDDYLVITKKLTNFKTAYPSADFDKVIELPITLANSGSNMNISLANTDSTYTESFSWKTPTTDISFEKIDVDKSDTTETSTDSNWAVSLASGGTPGEENSVSQKLPDLISPEGISPADKENITGQTAVNFSWKDSNTQTVQFEFLLSQSNNLTDGILSDTIIDETKLFDPKYFAEDLNFNIYYWQVIVSDGVGTKSSDIYQFTLTAPVYSNAIVINEFLPNPSGDETQNEWIELYNNSNDIVDLNGWALQDLAGATHKFVIGNINVGAKGFVIFSRPQTGITLNDDADGVKLFQPDGTVLDQTPEFSSSTKDYTWARQSDGDFSWTAMPTSGEANIFYLPLPTAPTGISPANQNIPVGQKINFQWTTTDTDELTYEFILSDQPDLSDILEDQINITKTEYQDAAVAGFGLGTYYWRVTAKNDAGRTNSPTYSFNIYNPVYSSAIKITELLPNPSDDAANEWIEIYNDSAQAVDLTGWQLEDASGSTHYFTIGNIAIGSFQYLVFSRGQTGIILNNDADGAKLLQPNGQVLDQSPLFANAPAGYAWERDSNNQFSWTASPTPGVANIFYLPPVTSNDNTTSTTETVVINKDPIKIKTGDHRAFLDKLVQVAGVVSQTNGQTFYLNDGSGQAKIYIQSATNIQKPPMHKGDIFQIIGVVDLYRGVYRILPRTQSDIEMIEPADKTKILTAPASSQKTTSDKNSPTNSNTNQARAPNILTEPLIQGVKAATNSAPVQPTSTSSSFWFQILKAVIGLALILLVLLIFKLRSRPKIKIIGGHFGRDET